MRSLVKADMKRIMVKILPWLLLAAAYAYMAVSLITGIDTSPDRNFAFLQKVVERTSVVNLIIGFAALLGIYGDEFKSMAMITVIGKGLTRAKFVFAKFIDTLILVALMTGITAIYVVILKNALGVTLNGTETGFLINMFIFNSIELVMFVTIASIFYFLSENAAVGLFAYLAFMQIIPVTLTFFMQIIPVTLTFAKMLSPWFANHKLDKLYVSGLISTVSSNLIIGDIVGAFLVILPTIAIYIGGALLINILVFSRKELDF